MRKLLRSYRFWVIVLLIAGVVAWALRVGRKSGVTISPETTYLTSPLRPDGMVDYVTAMDRPLREGVTEANNAAPLLIRALGPEALPETTRDRILLLLKMEPPGEQDAPFVQLDAFLIGQAEQAGGDKQPKSLPEPHLVAQAILNDLSVPGVQRKLGPETIAAWLKANEKPLALAVAAGNRDKCYIPPPPPEFDRAMLFWYPSWYGYGELVRALAARGMLKLADGDLEGAWRDVLAAFRLLRMLPRIGHVGFPFDLECHVSRAARAVAASDKLTDAQARRCLDDLEGIGELPALEKWAQCRRLLVLDFVCAIARLGLREALADARWVRREQIPDVRIEYDELLRAINKWYNRYEEGLREPDYPARERALNVLAAEHEALRRRLFAPLPSPGAVGRLLAELKRRMGIASTRPRSSWMDILARDPERLLLWSLTARGYEGEWDAMAVVELRLTKLAFALARCRRTKGEYPPALGRLRTAYIGSIPLDLFSGRPFRYKRIGKGYLLYSLGPNMKDDGAKEDEETNKDDIVVRVK